MLFILYFKPVKVYSGCEEMVQFNFGWNKPIWAEKYVFLIKLANCDEFKGYQPNQIIDSETAWFLHWYEI